MKGMNAAQPLSVLDTTIGVSSVAAGAVTASTRRGVAIANPLFALVTRPSALLGQQHRATWLDGLAERGAAERAAGRDRLTGYVDRVMPTLVASVLHRMRLTETLTQSIDVNAIASEVDYDAVVEMLDLTAIVCERIDLDLITAEILKRMDLTGMILQILDQIDLREVVRASSESVVVDTAMSARARRAGSDNVVARKVQTLIDKRTHRSAGSRAGRQEQAPWVARPGDRTLPAE